MKNFFLEKNELLSDIVVCLKNHKEVLKVKKVLLLVVTAALFSGCATQKTEFIHVGPNWNQLSNLPSGKDVKVRVVSEKESYKVGELMSFSVTSDKPGKLWLVSVGPDDKVSLLFPNEIAKSNDIAADTTTVIPGSSATWDMKADEPLGSNVVLALVTTGDMDRDQIVAILKGEAGQQQQTKAIAIQQRSPQWGSAKAVISVSGATR